MESLIRVFHCNDWQAEDWWGILAPEATFMFQPGWKIMREVLASSAARNSWSQRSGKLFFRGAATGDSLAQYITILLPWGSTFSKLTPMRARSKWSGNLDQDEHGHHGQHVCVRVWI